MGQCYMPLPIIFGSMRIAFTSWPLNLRKKEDVICFWTKCTNIRIGVKN